MKEENWELPEHLIYSICLKLPNSKSLVRFRSVSKQWNDTITSRDFIKNYYDATDDVFVFNSCGSKTVERYTISHCDDICLPPCLSLPLPLESYEKIIGSSSWHGLVFFRLRRLLYCQTSYLIWNPFTCEFRRIVAPVYGNRCNAGFGYDCVSDDYKVVFNYEDTGTWIASLKSKEWRNIDKSSWGSFKKVSVTVDADIYWIKSETVYNFNVMDETLTILPSLPKSKHLWRWRMGTYKQTLSVFNLDVANIPYVDTHLMHIWTLAKDKQSWEHLMDVPLLHPSLNKFCDHALCPIGFTQRGDLLLSADNSFLVYVSLQNRFTGVVPTQVEKVIELSFEFLSSVFGHWVEYLDYLLQSVLDAANYVASEGDLVRRVFDKEIDNHHEEKLLISQICCSHLEKLPLLQACETYSIDKDAVKNYLLCWRRKFLNQLISISKYHSNRLGSIGWIGGIGNHKDTFLPLFANLLGYYTLSKCIIDGKFSGIESMASQVVDMKDALSNFIGNPMISNLYALIIKLHKEIDGSSVGLTLEKHTEGCIVWNDFDPYFLLR